MKHDKKQHQVRKKIWKMPFLVDELFKDDDWKIFDSTAFNESVPSNEMKTLIQTAIEVQEEGLAGKAVRKNRIVRLLRYVAAAAVLIFISFYWDSWPKKNELPSTGDKQSAATHRARNVDTSWILIENKKPQSMLVDLPDGSHVRLFAQSHIRYAKNFTSNTRDIQLAGKAYFDVAADPQRPFSVFAADSKTTALGTSFTINTSLKNKALSVVLHSGKVLISSSTKKFKQVFLDRPGQQLTVNKLGIATLDAPRKAAAVKSTKLAIQDVDLLNLKNTPMSAVLRALENAFNHRIQIADKTISDIHYTGQFDVHKDQLKDILTTICLINELRYVAHADGSYTLYKQENTNAENINN